MQLCENGTAWDNVWVDRGINRCFYQSVSAVVLFIFIFIFGVVQCTMYSKYAIRKDQNRVPKSWNFIIQLCATSFLMCEAITHMILYNLYLGDKVLLGYEILEACLIIAACVMSIWLMAIERKSMLPSIPTRGQGIVLLLFWALFFIKENINFISWNNHSYWWHLKNTSDQVELALFILRYVCLLLLLFFGFTLKNSPYMLLDAETGNAPRQESTWSNVFIKLRMMFPYVWPKGNFILQISVFICLIILALGRVINVFVPIYSKYIVDSLTYQKGEENQTLDFRWDYILMFAMLSFLKGGGTGTTGFLNNTRSLLWIKVQQFTTRSIQVKLFSHLHSLSLHWHLGRKTGEVLRVVDRGTNSINNLLSYLLFQIVPTIIDIIIAIVYFITVFDYLFGLIVFASMSLYLISTLVITEWRTKFRRQMNLKDNAANAKAVDSLLNFETVKYYGASEFERSRYEAAILDYQSSEWKATASLNLLNGIQNVVNTIGLMCGSLLCAWGVINGINNKQLTVGDYVLFGTYLTQLYVPLNWLGTYYRMIQQSFIDMENMFDLLNQEKEIQDIPDAKDITMIGGRIDFKNVCFHYEASKPILKNISFSVPAGQTLALVGHTGCGKSTIVRLLFRFYDVQSGTILIDGQDITLVTQSSLRHEIGVVPQDTVLFNDNIRYNIRYGDVTAGDAAVEDAARAAEIHDRIMGFPKKYETVVGERGLKLSGGEKQRIAIARTLLKSPAIVLLDEATSALDTRTERNIQSSLSKVCENRTTVIVAHRLSTIVHADQIIVLDEGEILEQGTHDQLLKHGGHYAEMWNQQLISEKEAEQTPSEQAGVDGS